jgi:hypothetical protein
MRRLLLLVATCCMIAGIFFAPALVADAAAKDDAAKQLSVRFEAKVGDKASIAIRRSKLVPSLGTTVTAVSVYRMEITGRTADGYRILWTPQSLEFEGAPERIAVQLKAMAVEAMAILEGAP